MPTKNDDGASFRCTVWNRALRQEHSLEAGTKVFVNCKFPFTSFSLSFSCFIFYNKQPLLFWDAAKVTGKIIVMKPNIYNFSKHFFPSYLFFSNVFKICRMNKNLFSFYWFFWRAMCESIKTPQYVQSKCSHNFKNQESTS